MKGSLCLTSIFSLYLLLEAPHSKPILTEILPTAPAPITMTSTHIRTCYWDSHLSLYL